MSTTNTFSDGAFRQLWMDGVQEDLDKALVAKGIATVDTRATRIFHNPFNTTPVGSNGAKQVTYAVEAMTSSDDTLTVNQRATAAEQIDSYEQLMTSYDLMSQQSRRQAYRISDYIDQFVLNMAATKSGIRQIDNGYISSGTVDNTGYAISSSNANTIANAITEILSLGNAQENKGLFWVVTPYERTAILAYAQSHGFTVADSAISAGRNGSVGKQFSGLDLYVSNNLTHTTNLTIATNPTAGDTITLVVNGRSITGTFRASPSVAGEIKIGAAASNTQANIRAFLNGSGVGDGTDYFELATADRLALKMASPQSAPGTFALAGAFATNVSAITVYGSLKVAKSLTAGSDGFSTVIRKTIAGVYGSIFLGLPSDGMTFDMKSVSGQHGREIVTAQVYDATIWNNQKAEVAVVFTS
jgi:hypothetical protein